LELFHPAAYAKAIEHIYGEILHLRSDR
jgi:hypothetical protein